MGECPERGREATESKDLRALAHGALREGTRLTRSRSRLTCQRCLWPCSPPPGLYSVAAGARSGDPRPPTSTRCPPTPGAEAPAAWPHRPPAVGPAIEAVTELATGGPDRDARHGRALAPSRVCAVLAVAVTAATGWPASRGRRHPSADSAEIAQATVAKYLARRRGTPPSQPWRAFLSNHVAQLASVDFFTVPTATFRVLRVFVVLPHDRRRIVHVNVTAHPTAAWTAATAPRSLAVGERPTFHPARPRYDLRIGVSPGRSSDGDRRRADGASVSLAEPIR